MADPGESSPLLNNHNQRNGDFNDNHTEVPDSPKKATVVNSTPQDFHGSVGWTANGLPVSHGSVVGEPVARAQWNSGLFACCGRNDDFCSSDLEVCLVGGLAPCVLHGSNVERLGSHPLSFSNNCLSYSCLCLFGYVYYGCNLMAPLMTYRSRAAIRKTFNLEGNFEALCRSCGCCGSVLEDEVKLEKCESMCDFCTHLFCHQCALCQEGRELRRRLPHPGLNGRRVVVMVPPTEQTMGRGGN